MSSDDVLEAKIDGMRQSTEVRFDAFERQQAGQTSWLERLSNSVEKLGESLAPLFAMQTRIGHLEAQATDTQLDIDGLDTRMSAIETAQKFTKWALAGAFGLLTTGLGAMIPLVIENWDKIIKVFGG